MLVRRHGSKNADVKLTIGEHSHIRRAHYLLPTDGLPSAEAFLVAAPAGVVDKQRKSFEARWRDVTGRTGTVFRPVRELPKPAPKRKGRTDPDPPGHRHHRRHAHRVTPALAGSRPRPGTHVRAQPPRCRGQGCAE
ncbi:hypothetical protein ADK65_07625 [Streptomyces sp. NRRL B-1140]|nr:hypothetical protein ADK65_07625 [Streptomyces sp. NRRL B-1140]